MADIKNNTSADAPEDDGFFDPTEHKGLGTPATRAGVIEKLIKSGLIERKEKSLVPTAKGMALIAVLPEEIKSPELTANWEESLKLIEKGRLSGGEFMSGINALVSGLAAANAAPVPEMVSMFASMQNAGKAGTKGAENGKTRAAGSKVIGQCPRCNSDIIESAKGFFCSSDGCKFALWKDSRFWAAKGKTLTAGVTAELLKEGRISFSDLKSERTGKTYSAVVILADDGIKTDFKLEFNNSRKSGGGSV